jgi:cell volume regulation protein A
VAVDVHQLDQILLVGSGVLILAILAVRLSVSAGLPSLLVYLTLGLLLGSSGLGIPFDDPQLAQALGTAALMLILAEGGLTTNWAEVRPVLASSVLLGTLGSAVSVVVVAFGTHYLLGLQWHLAILFAAVLTPTDAAAVFSVLRAVPLRHPVGGTLEAESALNDPPIAVLIVALSVGDIAQNGVLSTGLEIGYQLAVGAAVGLAIGALGALVLRRASLPASGLYPLIVVSLCVFGYALAASPLHASGLAAVYLAALVLGNVELPHRTATRSFVEGIGWLSQIALFIMLGLLANPADLRWRHLWIGLAGGALLTFVARPVSVFVCEVWFRMPLREQLFVAWAGLRGAVPIVFATIPLAAGVEGADDLFAMVFVAVVIYTLVQAAPLHWLAAKCGVLSTIAREVEVEAAPLEGIRADLLQVRVPHGSKLAGVEVGELRLPGGARVSLVVRDGDTIVPPPSMRLRENDALLIVAKRDTRHATEERLRLVGQQGRLAGWINSTDS